MALEIKLLNEILNIDYSIEKAPPKGSAGLAIRLFEPIKRTFYNQ